MKVFIVVFSAMALILCYLVGRFFTTAFALPLLWNRFFWTFHILASLTIILAPVIYRIYPIKNPGFFYNTLQWSGYFFMGIYSVMIIFILISDTSLGLYTKFYEISPERLQSIRSILAMGTIMIAAIVSLLGLYVARKNPEVTKVSVPIAHLPREFNGFKILQLSDVHVGQTIKGDFVNAIVDIANGESPDVVVLTGDLIDGTTEQLAFELEGFKRLKSTYGTIMIAGNHEYYWNLEEWIKFWQSIGVKTLVNEHLIISKNDNHIVFAGVHDYSASRINPSYQSSPKEALHGAIDPSVKILLAHQPRTVYAASKAGIDLQLSGHTHSGQYFPYNLLIYFFQPFVKGLNRFDKTWLYINQGTGYWGPPTRLGASPEITLITLVKGDGA